MNKQWQKNVFQSTQRCCQHNRGIWRARTWPVGGDWLQGYETCLTGRWPWPSSVCPGFSVFVAHWNAGSWHPCPRPGGGCLKWRGGRCGAEGRPADPGPGCRSTQPPGRRGPDSQPLLCAYGRIRREEWSKRLKFGSGNILWLGVCSLFLASSSALSVTWFGASGANPGCTLNSCASAVLC